MIRKASIEDVPLLMEIEKICFKSDRYTREQIEWIVSGEKEAAYIYLHRSKPVGSVMVSIRGNRGRLISIGVHPDWRKKGIGKKLMDVAEGWFLKSGAKQVVLEVNVSNHEAVNLYSSLGFEVIGLLRNYYPNGSDAFQMAKRLEG